jgi:hypothetical protein
MSVTYLSLTEQQYLALTEEEYLALEEGDSAVQAGYWDVFALACGWWSSGPVAIHVVSGRWIPEARGVRWTPTARGTRWTPEARAATWTPTADGRL